MDLIKSSESSYLNLGQATEMHSLDFNYVLDQNGQFFFHWADFYETCDLLSDMIQRLPLAKKDLFLRETKLQNLSTSPVWIKSGKKVFQTSILNLYEQYILESKHKKFKLDPSRPIHVSLISSSGPFKLMSIVDFFNKDLYRDFIWVNLLRGNLPKRKFRIRTNSNILIEYGEKIKFAEVVCLEQIGDEGMLVSMDSDFYFNRLSLESSACLLLNSRTFEAFRKHNSAGSIDHPRILPPLFSSQKKDGLNLNLSEVSPSSSFDFTQTKKIYLFISYEQLEPFRCDAYEQIKCFLSWAKEIILKNYFIEKSLRSA